MKKTALITGASRGIGKACAIKLATDGYNIVLNYAQNTTAVQEVANQIKDLGGNVLICQADVANEAQVAQMFAQAQETFGGIDLLINNAGICNSKMFTDFNLTEWNEVFAVNVGGTFNCSKAAIPHMVHQKAGKIINISSIWGQVGASCEVAYSASKGAIDAMTKALAKELAPSNIHVNAVSPGVILTDMNDDLTAEDMSALERATPLGKIGQPEDIAATVAFLASDAANFITGQIISPNGGFVIR